jgi:hypothetical protein
MLPGSVRADEFTLTATAGGTTVISATLYGTASGTPGVDDITSMSGTVDGQSATILATSGPGVATTSPGQSDGYAIVYDNLLSLTAPYVDNDGLGFTLADGTLANLYDAPGDTYAELDASGLLSEAVTVTVVETPEASSLMLLGMGLLALMVMGWRRYSQTTSGPVFA